MRGAPDGTLAAGPAERPGDGQDDQDDQDEEDDMELRIAARTAVSTAAGAACLMALVLAAPAGAESVESYEDADTAVVTRVDVDDWTLTVRDVEGDDDGQVTYTVDHQTMIRRADDEVGFAGLQRGDRVVVHVDEREDEPDHARLIQLVID